MPEGVAHRRQAESNRELSARLAVDKRFHDWAVTTLFYEALHLVDAALHSRLGVHPSNHRDRQHHVYLLLKPIRAQYRQLRELSEQARYDCIPIDESDLKVATNMRDEVQAVVQRKLAG